MKETKEMREARHQLQELSASDPLARANMLRHVAACTQLLTGRPGVDALPSEPFVGAGFRFENGEAQLFATFTRNDAVERIYIAFDIDDARGLPIGIGLFRKEGDDVICYGLCKIWSPVGGGRAVLVPLEEDGYKGYFSFRKGQPFRWVAGSVPGDFDAGLRRTQARVARLMRSAAADASELRGCGSVVTNVGQTVFVRPFGVAA